MDFRQLIQTRGSVRAYRPDPIADSVLEQVLRPGRTRLPKAARRRAGSPRWPAGSRVQVGQVDQPGWVCHAGCMPKAINLYEAKTHLSELVDRAARGEEIVIARAGHPQARLGPVATKRVRRRPGGGRGKVWIANDFDAPLPPGLLRAFQKA